VNISVKTEAATLISNLFFIFEEMDEMKGEVAEENNNLNCYFLGMKITSS
jgi:hypothetical protein